VIGLKTYRFLVPVWLLLVLFSPLVAAAPISASENYSVSHNERDFLKEKIKGYEVQTDDYLIDIWHCQIRDVGNGNVELYGYTKCNRECDKVSVKLVLQQLSGSSWIDLKSYTFVDYQSDYAYGAKTVPVSRGKYYRVKSYHYAEDGSLEDETTATTDKIIIN
jgi:hypothetical protein